MKSRTFMNRGDLLGTNAGFAVNHSSHMTRQLAACLLALASLTSLNADDRPNIVLILCDDLGYADVGFNGAQDIVTPHLDRLAENGTIFSSAYVCHPFCGPSRMGLMTGRYPHSFGAPYNLPPTGLGITDFEGDGIPESEVMMSTMLQRAGYFTGAIGKWHLGITSEHHPNVRGFDDFYGFLGGGHMYFPERFGPIYDRQKRSGRTVFNEYIVPLEHNGVEVQETEYITDALSREAVRFVKQAEKKGKPFFLYLAYNAPHTPLEAKEEDLQKFAEIKDEKRRTYAAMVYAVDRGVGRVVEALKETDALDDTLIVFLSDNGGKIGGGSDNGPLLQGKGSVCEGGIRVPMFFHWPKEVPGGQQYSHPVTALDFYPTFAGLADATISGKQELDGVDIWDSLQQGQSPRPGQPIFALRHWNGFHNVGMRQDEWKVSKRGPKAKWQLFQIVEDVGETIDVSQQHPDIVKQLVEAGRIWSQTHVAPLWFDNKKAQQRWKDTKMPVYESTFQIP